MQIKCSTLPEVRQAVKALPPHTPIIIIVSHLRGYDKEVKTTYHIEEPGSMVRVWERVVYEGNAKDYKD